MIFGGTATDPTLMTNLIQAGPNQMYVLAVQLCFSTGQVESIVRSTNLGNTKFCYLQLIKSHDSLNTDKLGSCHSNW